MRISRLISILMIGCSSLSLAGLAKPILDFKGESVYSSGFCKKYGCRYVASSYDHADGIDFDQYLYRLQNNLYFVAARWSPFSDRDKGYNRVSSVSLVARATASNLKKLEAFLPTLINETAFGFPFGFRYDFKRKCARAAQASYDGGGLFEAIVLPGAQNLTTLNGQLLVSDHRTLTIACGYQNFNMVSVTLYWGVIGAWIDHSFGFNCSNPTWTVLPACPWAFALPRRIS